jgi:hypothetical protein
VLTLAVVLLDQILEVVAVAGVEPEASMEDLE